MAILGAPDVFGPEPQVEEEPALDAWVWKTARRTVWIYRVVWPIDNTGGNTIPDTWETDYTLQSATEQRAYGKTGGLLVAVYRKPPGAWVLS